MNRRSFISICSAFCVAPFALLRRKPKTCRERFVSSYDCLCGLEGELRERFGGEWHVNCNLYYAILSGDKEFTLYLWVDFWCKDKCFECYSFWYRMGEIQNKTPEQLRKTVCSDFEKEVAYRKCSWKNRTFRYSEESKEDFDRKIAEAWDKLEKCPPLTCIGLHERRGS